ncbi:MAG: hypothetical protein JWL84_3360 [Rhodospirillales bacterium]|jgi:CRP-like cAMP-binding protein|nr:hypothetical protein [Rhodospirillales bacterium]
MMEMNGDSGDCGAPWAVRPYDRPGAEELRDFRAPIKSRFWVEARRDILGEGQVPAELRVIVRGLACRYKIMPDGSRRIIGVIFPGEACNADIFCAEEMDHSVRAIVRTEIASVSRDDLLDSMQANPVMARIIWSSAAQDNTILRQWLVKMGHQKGHGRVAHLLYELYLRYQMAGAAGAESYILELTQDELADTLGMTPVHMNRVLQRLRKEGLIQLTGRRLTILDRRGLEAAADFDPKYRQALRRPPLGVYLGLRLSERVSAPA